MQCRCFLVDIEKKIICLIEKLVKTSLTIDENIYMLPFLTISVKALLFVTIAVLTIIC